MEQALALLSGTGSHVSSCTRNGLASFFAIRLFAVIISTNTVWEDDLQDLTCNSTQVGCHHQCYTELSPLSPFTLFTLQIVCIFTLALANSLYNGGSPRQLRHNFKISFPSMLGKIFIEAIFLFWHHMLYPNVLRQRTFKCAITPCEKTVFCTMLKSQQKNVFVMFMYTCSFASLLIGVRDVFFSW
ncbi:gap junction beta-1 protein-like [Heterodontus francisci]|uniref:gap junction beta-1 protein-like n=1 Tax=Heterodontus francisci TaxID=7792 RepID=UPI00355BA262